MPDASSPSAPRGALAAGPRAEIARLLAEEIAGPVTPDARALAAEIRRRHGPGVVAVVQYGPSLRVRSGAPIVHDFYAIVDAYGPAYRSWRGGALLAAANRFFGPNVLGLVLADPGGRLRAKYALISARDFVRATGPGAAHTLVGARFCLPLRAAELRDDAARDLVVRGARRAVSTALDRLLPLLPAAAAGTRVPMTFVWEHVFRELQRAELRTEPADTIARLYAGDAGRFDRLATLAARDLARRGRLRLEEDGAFLRFGVPPRRRVAARARWRLRRRVAMAHAAANLLKSAFTLEEWLPHALWRIERHGGARVAPTPRQRRHPLLFGWPIVWRALRRRELR